ncbi:MAG: AAA family ATPase [Planctomycetota bacterium]|jgi:ATP-dependent 26S proteasome regulatory subunit
MSDVLDVIRERMQCRFPILFLSTWEEERWESELASLSLDLDRGIVTWTATAGATPALNEDAPAMSPDRNGDAQQSARPDAFLAQVREYPRDHVFLLKDFHPWLSDPLVVRRLRDLVPSLIAQNKTVLIMGPTGDVPVELIRDAISIELPLPGLGELHDELQDLMIQRQHHGEAAISIDQKQEERLLKTLLGLTTKQARLALSRALLGRSSIDAAVFDLLISEKKHMVQGSELLEFQGLAEGAADIGGLEALKDWVRKRAEAFSERAREQGIPSPKGVLLLGVQGCGKSLTARAIARMMSFPLVRLDVAMLLSGESGKSEKNLRDVLSLMEMIAPAVLWLDEVEKGFAGVGEDGGDTTMMRLLGRFLTWMQEKPAPVFVVATANSVTGLPPEMLRRGRFDELFFVDLPNFHERKQILDIHLRKRDLDPARFDVARLAEQCEGYSGAEIEQAVLTAVVEAFNSGGDVTQKQLLESLDDTVPLSVTMEEKIFELREWARTRCRAATPDSRLLQMLEDEQRQKAQESGGGEDDETEDNPDGVLNLFDDEDLAPDDDDEQITWQTLLKEGQVRAALLELIADRGQISLAELQDDVGGFIEADGGFGLALRSDPRVVLWLGLSAEVAAPLARLVIDRKVYLHPTTGADYPSGLRGASLPFLPGLPEQRCERPSWLPVNLSIDPPEFVDERLTRIARMQLNR